MPFFISHQRRLPSQHIYNQHARVGDAMRQNTDRPGPLGVGSAARARGPEDMCCGKLTNETAGFGRRRHWLDFRQRRVCFEIANAQSRSMRNPAWFSLANQAKDEKRRRVETCLMFRDFEFKWL